jgi:hypothetical protein
MIHKIKAMYDEGRGSSLRAIAAELKISRNTVRKYLRMSAEEITAYREGTAPGAALGCASRVPGAPAGDLSALERGEGAAQAARGPRGVGGLGPHGAALPPGAEGDGDAQAGALRRAGVGQGARRAVPGRRRGAARGDDRRGRDHGVSDGLCPVLLAAAVRGGQCPADRHRRADPDARCGLPRVRRASARMRLRPDPAGGDRRAVPRAGAQRTLRPLCGELRVLRSGPAVATTPRARARSKPG